MIIAKPMSSKFVFYKRTGTVKYGKNKIMCQVDKLPNGTYGIQWTESSGVKSYTVHKNYNEIVNLQKNVPWLNEVKWN